MFLLFFIGIMSLNKLKKGVLWVLHSYLNLYNLFGSTHRTWRIYAWQWSALSAFKWIKNMANARSCFPISIWLRACVCVCGLNGNVFHLFTVRGKCVPSSLAVFPSEEEKKKRKTAFKCCKGLNSVTSCIRPVCHRVTQNRTVWESNFWLMCVACILPLCTVEFFIKSHYEPISYVAGNPWQSSQND